MRSLVYRLFAQLDVLVNNAGGSPIAPSLLDTNDSAANFIHNEDTLPFVTEPVAMKRVGQPREVTGAAAYFASEDSSYNTTGTCVTIDGGVRP